MKTHKIMNAQKTEAAWAPVPPACYSVEDAAKRIGVGRAYLFTLIKEGTLASMKLGRRRLIPHAAIEALIAAKVQ
jgi:excisionase family DNA binding protein